MNNESDNHCDARRRATSPGGCRPILCCCVLIGLVGLTSCGKSPEVPAKEMQVILQKPLTRLGPPPSKLESEWAAATDLATRKALVSDWAVEAEDIALAKVLNTLRAEASAAERPGLLMTFYEELDLRPPVVRLPLLLELARETTLEESLRISILAELGATLNADHGQAWDAWAATLEQHLKDTYGLLDLRERLAE